VSSDAGRLHRESRALYGKPPVLPADAVKELAEARVTSVDRHQRVRTRPRKTHCAHTSRTVSGERETAPGSRVFCAARQYVRPLAA